MENLNVFISVTYNDLKSGLDVLFGNDSLIVSLNENSKKEMGHILAREIAENNAGHKDVHILSYVIRDLDR